MQKLTKAEAKKLLGIEKNRDGIRTDADLARALGITGPSVSGWGKGDDSEIHIPMSRVYQIRAILAERREKGLPPPDMDD